jgi:hypothetical protein
MSNFFSGLKDGISGSNILPDGDVLKRKIDYQRENFLKGVSTTKHGKKEDPTYLHFRFIFDFGNTGIIDPQTFLAPSPLFRDLDSPETPEEKAASNKELISAADKGGEALSDVLKRTLERKGKFYTDTDFFYGSKLIINSRAQRGAFPINDGIAYMGAQAFLAQRSEKRKQMLSAFKKGLSYINEKCPYYFQSISGLDSLLKVDIKNLHKEGGKPYRMGTLTIDCMESIDMRMFSLSELYRKAIYDYTFHRVMLPENLRKFRMWLVVSEIRNIQLSYGINDVLNPFSIPSVAQGANFLDNFNSQTGLLSNTEGILQKSKSGEGTDQFGSYTLGPYAFIYQLDQCEFDFDDSYPSYSTIDNKGGQAVSSKFKIHVGRVTDLKLQFNLLSDVMKKNDMIKSMVLSDVWGSKRDGYNLYDYAETAGIEGVDFSDKPNPADFFKEMASKFITNSVADLKEQGFNVNGVNISATSLQGALLGNIYGVGGINPGSALRSVSSIANTIRDFKNNGVPNPFKDNSPQARGLGGPLERQYPDINQDVYNGVPGPAQQNLGTAYNGGASAPGGLNEDAYPTNPEGSLGLPDRQYPTPGGDEYKDVPGKDLGVPKRTYPSVDEDIYKTNPGSSLGLPDRQYPAPGGDEYKGVPGKDLGVPDRAYPEPGGDVYSNTPGKDLGLPDRLYPSVNEDVYVEGSKVETKNIGEVYTENNNQYDTISEKVYGETQDTSEQDRKNMGDVYPNEDYKYGSINEKEYEEPMNTTMVNQNNMGDVYIDNTNEYSVVSENVYPSEDAENFKAPMGEVYEKKANEYGRINDDEYIDSRGFNETLNDDVYKTVPGRDLGVPGRSYNSLNDREYPKDNGTKTTQRIGRTYPGSNNENN